MRIESSRISVSLPLSESHERFGDLIAFIAYCLFLVYEVDFRYVKNEIVLHRKQFEFLSYFYMLYSGHQYFLCFVVRCSCAAMVSSFKCNV